MNAQNQLPKEWAKEFHKVDCELFHRDCAKSKASLLKLLRSGTLNERIAKDLAFILATHHTEYEKYMNEDEAKAAMELNNTYWDLYEFPFAWIR